MTSRPSIHGDTELQLMQTAAHAACTVGINEFREEGAAVAHGGRDRRVLAKGDEVEIGRVGQVPL